MSESLLRTHVRDLRHVLGENVIETVVGRGYRFLADVSAGDDASNRSAPLAPKEEQRVAARADEEGEHPMNIVELDTELNALILKGEFLRAFDAFFHEDVEMQENDSPPIVGFRPNREREEGFASAIATLNEVRLLGAAALEDVSFSEWVIDFTLKDGGRVRLEQVAVRRWRGGKVLAERFYYDPHDRGSRGSSELA